MRVEGKNELMAWGGTTGASFRIGLSPGDVVVPPPDKADAETDVAKSSNIWVWAVIGIITKCCRRHHD
jgi:hypothetical protein